MGKKIKRECFIQGDICCIPLASGEIAICDRSQFEKVRIHNWHLIGDGYPSTLISKKYKMLHRFIFETDKIIDHINGNKLDNRLINLREATHTENMQNRKTHKCNPTGYKGVTLSHRKVNKYRVSIRVNGKNICLGSYEKAIYAAIVYDEAARKYFGPFAKVNFPTVF